MKAIRFLFFLGCILIIHQHAYAQSTRCGSSQWIELAEKKYPGYTHAWKNVTAAFQKNENAKMTLPICTIQVVVHDLFHAVHDSISDSLIFRQMDILNKCFNHQNADTMHLRPIFGPITGKGAGIYFQLAKKTPLGVITNGIERLHTPIDGFGDSLLGFPEKVKNAQNGGLDPWDTQKFMNIWVCDTKIPGGDLLFEGYATPPPNLPNWPSGFPGPEFTDGIVIQNEFFGDRNPLSQQADSGRGKLLVHETGHYLGLRHIWGDEYQCQGDDGIGDTPAADGPSNMDCDLLKNSCLDSILNINFPDMVENYMDYSHEDCQNTFTNGQAIFIRWVADQYRTGLCQAGNSLVASLENVPQIKVFPNPAQNILFLESIQGEYTCTISNAIGQLLKTEKIHDSMHAIDISGFENGLYFLFIQTQTDIQMVKWVKAN